ncbi:gamma-glutamyltransferase 2. Threonine peptidase. MEROPS family T03 [Pseudomonas sp. 43mfcvi1.1]|uniref:gamma-glutamyltransferase family protein n=1 Tax=Pseudomonas sp. 43mfcvi1.1 TaxID=1761894 RepID=UPI000D6C0FD0|nr:gamma-glutamyltransferase family protein [Pseudomonas sp. 43mfcvi1.1]PWJ32884.1 gamma-glutamyltransferase 2 [Pseudomonas sp. 43mfcvi1.1]SSB98542.1 gamma-glutamyltransferase 2. Threonine peptidase. MEROPS family T03 [Pseudomonas sp. 43mfcvi1.1]
MFDDLDYSQPYASARSPVMGSNMVACSQPLAAQAGLDMLRKGGNAVDAAIAAAMVLTVVEPTGCGIGSDAFAIVWDGSKLQGLNASGRAPQAWTPEFFAGQSKMPQRGWPAVTVPGAVSAWVELSERYGKLPFASLAEPAIGYARDGYQVTPIIAQLWKLGAERLKDQPGFAECFLPDGQAPQAGEKIRLKDHARTLELIAQTKGEAFYRGELAQAIIAHANANGSVMSLDDLATHTVDWIDTLSVPYAGAVVHELPPNGQGIATLSGLTMLEALGVGEHPVDSLETVHPVLEAMKLALADLDEHVADNDHMRVPSEHLLDKNYLMERAGLVTDKAANPGHGSPKPGGTVYLSAADESGMMISFIQSNYMGFGSGVVVPGTGISLQNRGAGFSLDPQHVNYVAPRKRPFHTIIPGFVMNADGTPLMSFGLMGGPMQAQGHLQMMMRILRYKQNPQAAADAPRWRLESGLKVAVERAFDPQVVKALRAKGHDIVIEEPNGVFAFGGAQIIQRTTHGYVGGTDPRKDGLVAAY